jgi:DNA replication and repair protein RecF
MQLSKFNITNFRNIPPATLLPGSGVNVIVGPNGSGKTSLLEAVYYLGHARSFRTPHSEHLIRFRQEGFVLYGEVLHREGSKTTIGIEKERGREKILLNGQMIKSKSELVMALPIQLIVPDDHRIIQDAPRYRRKFLDWGVFHVKPNYLELWKQFQHALKQRNMALRQNWSKQSVAPWNEQLVKIADEITTIKTKYVETLNRCFQSLNPDHSGLPEVEVSYRQGWPKDKDYGDLLEQNWDKDREKGITQYGPHRADLTITVAGVPAKQIVSRGQQKFLSVLLKLAQAYLVQEKTAKPLVLLIDDIASEMDRYKLEIIASVMAGRDWQVFITAVEADHVKPFVSDGSSTMFHVEHGEFTQSSA